MRPAFKARGASLTNLSMILQFAPVSQDCIEEIEKTTAENQILSRFLKLTLTGVPRHQWDVQVTLCPSFNRKLYSLLWMEFSRWLQDSHSGRPATRNSEQLAWWSSRSGKDDRTNLCLVAKLNQPSQVQSWAMQTLSLISSNTLKRTAEEFNSAGSEPVGPWQILVTDLCLNN